MSKDIFNHPSVAFLSKIEQEPIPALVGVTTTQITLLLIVTACERELHEYVRSLHDNHSTIHYLHSYSDANGSHLKSCSVSFRFHYELR